MDNTFDYIVVGAGTAGCLLANRLSADPDKRVLLLEAGGKDNYHWIHIPVGYLHCINNPRTDWLLRTVEEKGLNGRSLIYPRGRVLGGCSSINGMIYMRGQARDYDGWANLTGENGWSWSACLEDFKAHEDNYRLEGEKAVSDDDLHAGGGEWRVEKQRLNWEILDAYAAAANEAGIPATPDFNSGDNTGTGYFEVNQRSGWRWNSSKAFLNPVKDRKNLEIRTNAQVKKLRFDRDENGQKVCVGADLIWNGQDTSVQVRGEMILSAGAVNSPAILQYSGVGDAEYLQQQGIRPEHELPGVGRNLQDHLQLRTIYRVEGVKTLNEMAGSLHGKARIGLEYLLKRSGPMSMAPSQLGIFTRSAQGQEHANIQFHVQPLSLEAFGQPLHPWPGITSSVCNLNPTSRGTVLVRGNDSMKPPEIAPNYLSTDEDRKVAADSIRMARKIAEQPALAQYNPQEVKPGLSYESDEQLVTAAGDIGTTIFHPVGTTKMGRADDPMTVVDSHLRVMGIRGLRVVDAGIMPTIVSGNTNSPTLMIAEKAASWIRAENRA
ncbi:GMC family oxidoreductase [Kiloniella sp. b19]|uniref:GMC family oxidoreductase n=1 Tax=Kiloniella sp. GXU_MW_B19 TaxID=3141326 RepID=UPI0031D3577B